MAETAGAPRLLVVDDDPAIADFILRLVRSQGLNDAVHVTTAREALDALDGVEIVLLDYQLPDANGLEVLAAIRARPNPPSVVLITAHGNEAFAASALRLGADDYLAKDPALPEMLPRVLERIRRHRELRKALEAADRDRVRVERLTAMGELTVTLHHAINNPLMSASAGVELLLADPGLPATKRSKTLEEVQSSLQRIRDIIRQIGDLRAARTKPYLPGMHMVDLDAPGTQLPALQRGAALVYLADEDLSRVAALLLRHAGYAVERCATLEDLRSATSHPGVALVLVQGGTDAVGAHPLGGFDPPLGRGYLVVALVAGDGGPALAAGADRVVELPFDPGTFTADMAALVR